GNGDGSFQAVRDYEAGAGPAAVAGGDLNGGGRPHPAGAGGGLGRRGGGRVGNRDGTVPARPSAPGGRDPGSVAVGDFNGDGIPDLVAANLSDYTVSVLLGNGDGSFQAAAHYAAGAAQFVAVGDFRGTGVLDLAVGGSGVSVLLGAGDGTF